MEGVWEFVGSYWWLVFPLGGVLGGAVQGLREWDDRRRKDKIELARIKYGQPTTQPQASRPGKVTEAEIRRVLAEHDEIRRRWLDYELDVAKLIDYPMMSDMREPLTVEFHRTLRAADSQRPDRPKDLKDPDRFLTYRSAVNDLALAFDVAEREARRRRTTDFTDDERKALGLAKQLLALAEDRGATHAERQAAYRRAMHTLEGLVAVPDAASEAFERRIAGEIEGRDDAGPAGPAS